MRTRKKVRMFAYKLILPPNTAISFSDIDVGNEDRVIKTDIHETDSHLVRFYCGNTQVTHFGEKCIVPSPIPKKTFKVATNKKLCDLTSLESEFYEKVRSPAVATVFFTESEVRRMRELVKIGKMRRQNPSKSPGFWDIRKKHPTLPSDFDDKLYFCSRAGQAQFLIYSHERKPPYEPDPCVHRDYANHPVAKDYIFALSFAIVSQVKVEDVSFRLLCGVSCPENRRSYRERFNRTSIWSPTVSSKREAARFRLRRRRDDSNP